MNRIFIAAAILLSCGLCLAADETVNQSSEQTFNPTQPCFSGIYPHLANFNKEGECGTGAVVPWANRLWTISYGPHCPYGGSDRLYEIDNNLDKITRPESIGGTHANRMIHKESQQLFIGCYAIDKDRKVRIIPNHYFTPEGQAKPKDWSKLPGRLTGCARHLTDSENRIYIATMEEGMYDVNVNDLSVVQLYEDSNHKSKTYFNTLPGYHGKGFYSGQGRVLYSNNGEQSPAAMSKPETPSGALGSWDGKGTAAENWTVVLRNQFTEITGPGGIYGNENPDSDPIWSEGWDHRSVIFMVLDGGKWYKYRLPKASHCYDGAHGWNTEWPRIREVNDPETFLMTMHGCFWSFPKSFRANHAVGIRPKSTYLKVIGDFCYWNGKIVCGCDDTAMSEFLNKTPFKGDLAGPGQSNSNLWFADPARLDNLGPALGRGAVWYEEPVAANEWSEPYLFAGWDKRSAWLSADKAAELTFEVDLAGNGNWTAFKTVQLQPQKTSDGSKQFGAFLEFAPEDKGEWIRVKSSVDLASASCYFQYQNNDNRSTTVDSQFNGLVKAPCQNYLGALIWVRGDNQRLAVVAQTVTDGKIAQEGYYELTEDAKLVKIAPKFEGGEAGTIERIKAKVAIPDPTKVCQIDDLSVLLTLFGKQYRLPIGCEESTAISLDMPKRLDREVATERDLLHCAGTFYELPAINAGSLPKIRPVATHNLQICEYGSYRGLLILSGIDPETVKDASSNPQIIRSDDGKAALWAGCIDDLWSLGKAVGRGSVWKNTDVKANEPSLPYLATGFDKKSMTLENLSDKPVSVTLEADITGTGVWKPYKTFVVEPGKTLDYAFPASFNCYWLRTVSDSDAKLSASFQYE